MHNLNTIICKDASKVQRIVELFSVQIYVKELSFNDVFISSLKLLIILPGFVVWTNSVFWGTQILQGCFSIIFSLVRVPRILKDKNQSDGRKKHKGQT
jgi:hypothetical protein